MEKFRNKSLSILRKNQLAMRLAMGSSVSGNVTLCSGAYQTLEGCDALLLVTEWNEFRNPDFGKVKGLLKTPTVFDGRNIYSPEALREQGFKYIGIGRA